MRIRKLTPLECWQLMGFDDDFYKAKNAGISDTQLYRQAGNSTFFFHGVNFYNLCYNANVYKKGGYKC